MEINKQIRKYRNEFDLSQEDLADKIFVTRQTISNWENGKNYPDIHSLTLLSQLFGVSLDILVKGDIEDMREEIRIEDIKKFNHDSAIFSILLIISVLSIVPLFLIVEDFVGIIIWGVIFTMTMYYAFKIEKQKKAHDIQTYKEILAFYEGKRLDEIERNREYGKRPYQVFIAILISGVIGFVLSIGVCMFLKYLGYL